MHASVVCVSSAPPDQMVRRCGVQDGLTYESDCLAACQGVAVTQQGRCGEPPALLALLPASAQGRCRGASAEQTFGAYTTAPQVGKCLWVQVHQDPCQAAVKLLLLTAAAHTTATPCLLQQLSWRWEANAAPAAAAAVLGVQMQDSSSSRSFPCRRCSCLPVRATGCWATQIQAHSTLGDPT